MQAPENGGSSSIPRAVIERDGAVWRSPRFDDVYFSSSGGLAETEHVFLGHNQLPERWRTAARFTVGELGFGSGLNFAATWRRFLDTAPPQSVLDYIAVEAWPLSAADQREALRAWPELNEPAEALCQLAESWAAGFNLRVLASGRVRLLLLVGEVVPMLASASAAVDAWYLDGFAPAKNPAMWTPTVLEHVARLSALQASVATYTAAGQVRRDLQAAGFQVERVTGFGAKREMLRGRIETEGGAASTRSAVTAPSIPPWFERPRALRQPHVAVVGGGLAGVSTARALAEQGVRVTLCAPSAGFGRTAASRAPAMTVRPWPERSAGLRAAFYRRCFDYLVGQHAASSDESHWRALHWNGIALRRSERAVSGDWPGGWLDPQVWLTALEHHPGIERRSGPVHALAPFEDGGWELLSGGEAVARVDAVVVAVGADELPAPLDRDRAAWALEPAAGQLSVYPAGAAETEGHPTRCYGGHAIPAGEQWVLGSSFRRGSDALDESADEEATYRDALAAVAPELERALPRVPSRRFNAVRATVADRLPLLGPVVDASVFAARYATLQHGRLGQHFPPMPYRRGLFMHAGHGSRGATAALLSAQVIAAGLLGAPLPVESELWCATHPARFLVRRWRRAQGEFAPE